MILVTGGAGQVATALARDPRVRVVGRPEFDFVDPASVARAMRGAPALVVNAAAYTAVDAAETDAAAARVVNAEGPGVLARLCAEAGVPLIHLSTDYVYDGSKGAPYVETDATNPLGVYGATKLAGEAAAREAWARVTVLRTAWVYSATGKNFVRTMLNATRKTDTLRVVADQRGCPTAAADLAVAILAVADRMLAGWRDEFAGIFHAAGTGETTWHGLAETIFEVAAPLGWPRPTVVPIQTEDWPTPVARPADSRLDCSKLADTFGTRLPDWQDGLRRTMAEICAPA